MSDVKNTGQVPTLKINNNNDLAEKNDSQLPTPSKQYSLDVSSEIEKKVDGIEMGVLENGIPYLTQGGLSKMCGVDNKTIRDIEKEWELNYHSTILGKDRISFIKQELAVHDFDARKLAIEIKTPEGVHYAYPDVVCAAILEYFAYESKLASKEVAQNSFRKFAKYGMQQFIYKAVGYELGDKFSEHNKRQSLLQNSVPAGYFSIFHEVNPLVIDLINIGFPVNDRTIPDGSVGRCWSEHWNIIHGFFDEDEQAISYQHTYPDSYRQAKANSWIKPKAYPESALPAFRQWFRNEYLPNRLPEYILRKAKILKGGKEQAQQIAEVFKAKALADN